MMDHLRGKLQKRNLCDRLGTEVALQFASHKAATACSLRCEPKVQIVCNASSVSRPLSLPTTLTAMFSIFAV